MITTDTGTVLGMYMWAQPYRTKADVEDEFYDWLSTIYDTGVQRLASRLTSEYGGPQKVPLKVRRAILEARQTDWTSVAGGKRFNRTITTRGVDRT